MTPMNPEKAARRFLEMLIARARDGVLKGRASELENGPRIPKPSERDHSLYQWFQSLDSRGKANALSLMSACIDSTVFGCLVLLDGLTGGNPIKGETSDFALYLQTYQDEAARTVDAYESRVRINLPSQAMDLHDLFKIMLKERENNG
jgi:hypothetical protein